MAEMLSLVTGWDVTAGELVETAQRIVSAKKWYNIRHGWSPADDTLPARFFSEPIPDGASRGAVLLEERLQSLVREYNLARGWTAEGRLPDELLDKLNIPHTPISGGVPRKNQPGVSARD